MSELFPLSVPVEMTGLRGRRRMFTVCSTVSRMFPPNWVCEHIDWFASTAEFAILQSSWHAKDPVRRYRKRRPSPYFAGWRVGQAWSQGACTVCGFARSLFRNLQGPRVRVSTPFIGNGRIFRERLGNLPVIMFERM